MIEEFSLQAIKNQQENRAKTIKDKILNTFFFNYKKVTKLLTAEITSNCLISIHNRNIRVELNENHDVGRSGANDLKKSSIN